MNDLRDLFARQRQAESAGLPSFAATVAGGHRQVRRRAAQRGLRLYGAASAAALVVLAAVMLHGRFGGAPAVAWSAPLGVQLTAVTWHSPTDFLLKTPDADALHGMPRLVRMRDLKPTPPAPVNDTND